MSDPAKMLYLALISVPMMPVAAFISLADGILYPWYMAAPRVFGLSPHADQQIGGLIMWVPGSLVFWAAMSVIFFRWALAQEKQEHPSAAATDRTSDSPGVGEKRPDEVVLTS
jgi:putative membrane protein